VTEFIYRYNTPDRAHVFLSFQLETTSRATEVAAVLDELERGGMKGCDISDDEMAKSHARYMIGGASDVPNERIFRFGETFSANFFSFSPFLLFSPHSFYFNFLRPDAIPNRHNLPLFDLSTPLARDGRTHTLKTAEFPERPGALRKFLSSLRNMGWNISLFHYRNHGAGE
jgi:threonine dehydratase